MSFERALKVDQEPQNWLLHHGNYQGHRFSLLKEINAETVKNMKPVFTVALSGFQSGGRYAHGNLEATPLVEDGMMYVPDGWGSVYAIDVSAGKKGIIKWKMDPGIDRAWAGDVACCGINNRGVALWKDKVISIALDGRMFAIDKATGEVVWERKIAEPALGETMTIAPLIVRDLAIVGAAGGELGIRGYIEATDLNTGKAAWRTYTIPGAGEPGSETWKDGKERWQHGGGSVWETATYDPESDTFYQGIGNAGPDWDPEYRPGDNKWAASVLAINPGDGKIKWGYQYTPNDPYDYDEISEHPIIDAKVNGEDRELVVHAARNGFFYTLDRTNGSFIAGKQYVDQLNWTPGLDPKTGRPLNYDPNADVQIYAEGSHGTRAKPKSEKLCPSNNGGKNWEPTRLQPGPRSALHSVDRGLQLHRIGRAAGHGRPGRPDQAARAVHGGRPQDTGSPLRQPQGHRSGDRRDQGRPEARISEHGRCARDRRQSGLPRSLRRHVRGLRCQNPERDVELQRRQPAIQAPPVSYSVNGKQYIAVLVGARMWPFIVQNAPELKNQATASMLYVFSL